MREWAQKPASEKMSMEKMSMEKMSMEKVKVKLEMAEHTYYFAPVEYLLSIQHQNQEAYDKMKEFKPKRWIVL